MLLAVRAWVYAEVTEEDGLHVCVDRLWQVDPLSRGCQVHIMVELFEVDMVVLNEHVIESQIVKRQEEEWVHLVHQTEIGSLHNVSDVDLTCIVQP